MNTQHCTRLNEWEAVHRWAEPSIYYTLIHQYIKQTKTIIALHHSTMNIRHFSYTCLNDAEALQATAGVIGIDVGTSCLCITNALSMNELASNELTNHQDRNW